MAGVPDTARVVIKKEIDDDVESSGPQESPHSQGDGAGSQKQTKVWTEDEIRSLIELQKGYIQKLKDGNYTRKQLMEDVAQELNLIGYDATPENVRYKMKYLRTRYKGACDYNAKHVEKKKIPFHDELSELFSMESYDDPEPSKDIKCNGSSDISSRSSGSERMLKKKKTVPAPHVDLKAVVTTRKKVNSAIKAIKPIKKKAKRAAAQPLFQCGFCMNKFKTSYDMHDHPCKAPSKTNNVKKKTAPVENVPLGFHWNSLITMQFLDLLKEYQESHKNSNFRKGNIWVNMSALMSRNGHKIHPKVLARRWTVLSSTFRKTLAYNKTHKDKKKCAFFKRLQELYSHPSSFDCFYQRNMNSAGKQTADIPTPKLSQPPSILTRQPSPVCASSPKFPKENRQTMQPAPNSVDLMTWLNNTWAEYKEMERRRQAAEEQRHNELMEMLSYLIDSKH